MSDLPNYYNLLGIEVGADELQIKTAIREKVRSVTDKESPLARQLRDAYEVLTDPHKRSRYDAQLVMDKGAVPERHQGVGVTWEYLTLKSSRNYGTTKYYINDDQQRELKNARLADVLNMIGEQGWEVVGISSVGVEQVYVFKRSGTLS
jgi:hypothetical protein